MPTYALLGATGATGSSILRYLLAESGRDLRLKILVRSTSKLMKAFPNLNETSPFEISIIEGTSTDSSALERCLEGADAILSCVGSNNSTPGQSLTYDTAAATIDTLKTLRKVHRSEYRTPTVLMLRAEPINDSFATHMPIIAKLILNFCLHFAYADLRRAGDLYGSTAKEDPELFQVIFVDPGALHDAEGTERTGHRLVVDEEPGPDVSYADLGAGFCELAERCEEFKGKGVGVSATGKVNRTWGANLQFLLDGAKNRILYAVGLA